MIEEPKALTIVRKLRRPSATQIAAFQGVPTGFVVDALFGAGSMGAEIAPLLPQQGQIAGPALTADNRPSDVLALMAALDFVQPGDVVVTGACGYQGCAAAGDRVAGMAKNGGAIALVTDGPVRDLDGLQSVGLPVWCSGINPGSPFATGPGKVGTPVLLSGQRVESGDMIVADQDGVVVVPFAQIDAVAARLPAIAVLERELDAEVQNGRRGMDRVKALIEGGGVTWID